MESQNNFPTCFLSSVNLTDFNAAYTSGCEGMLRAALLEGRRLGAVKTCLHETLKPLSLLAPLPVSIL